MAKRNAPNGCTDIDQGVFFKLKNALRIKPRSKIAKEAQTKTRIHRGVS